MSERLNERITFLFICFVMFVFFYTFVSTKYVRDCPKSKTPETTFVYAGNYRNHSGIDELFGLGLGEYPPCQSIHISDFSNDLEHTLSTLRNTKILSSPFTHAFYCNLFKWDLYEGLARSFPDSNFFKGKGLRNPFDKKRGMDRGLISLSDFLQWNSENTKYCQ